jgi:hypothetical protein
MDRLVSDPVRDGGWEGLELFAAIYGDADHTDYELTDEEVTQTMDIGEPSATTFQVTSIDLRPKEIEVARLK